LIKSYGFAALQLNVIFVIFWLQIFCCSPRVAIALAEALQLFNKKPLQGAGVVLLVTQGVALG